VLPERLIALLGLAPHREIWARSYDGSYSRRPVYFARLIFEGRTLPVVQCVAVNRETVLVGRNVLNHFVLTLNGPRLQFDL
jgi:hypothetical protein